MTAATAASMARLISERESLPWRAFLCRKPGCVATMPTGKTDKLWTAVLRTACSGVEFTVPINRRERDTIIDTDKQCYTHSLE
jgi:hypothetical protein